MSCNSLRNYILYFHQISKLFLKCAKVLNNYFRPCNKATVHKIMLHLDSKSFF